MDGATRGIWRYRLAGIEPGGWLRTSGNRIDATATLIGAAGATAGDGACGRPLLLVQADGLLLLIELVVAGLIYLLLLAVLRLVRHADRSPLLPARVHSR